MPPWNWPPLCPDLVVELALPLDGGNQVPGNELRKMQHEQRM